MHIQKINKTSTYHCNNPLQKPQISIENKQMPNGKTTTRPKDKNHNSILSQVEQYGMTIKCVYS